MDTQSRPESRNERFSGLLGIGAAAALAVGLLFGVTRLQAASSAIGVNLPDSPVFAVADTKPNVLMVLDNSNSMDEAPSGAAVGSNSPDSKSEIARGVIKNLLTSYNGLMNVGLMSYKQNAATAGYLHNSPYDASYNPANYDPTYTGSRKSTTKKYRQLKPGSTTEYVYYNIALPFYSSNNEGTLYCYSATASFDNGAETYPNGPWDTYACYRDKAGTSDASPGTAGSGYSTKVGNYTFTPTDSDLAQNILDFGTRMASYYVSRTWMRNDSPGRGYLNTPIATLDSTQSATLTAKLACNIPDEPTPCNVSGVLNAGLTPIEGTLNTAKDYFGGTLSRADEGFTSATYPLPTSCGGKYVILLTDGLPDVDKDGNVITNPTTALSRAAASAAALKTAGVSTYVVGFALPYGTDPNSLNQIAASGGTGTAYSASDQASLNAALSAIFADIDAKSASSGATTANSTALSTDTLVFKASFNTADWSGSLGGYPVDASTGIASTPTWNATIPAAASRRIYTWNGSSAVQFTWATIPTSQQTALGSSDVVDYLRGDRSKEGTTFRTRSSVLGDIVDSAPVYIKEYDGGTGKPEMSLVAIGANDGMLHIFDGTTGAEKYAYVPAGINFNDLKTITSPSYKSPNHKYFVDGQIAISARSDLTSGRNILVATLGRGGRGAFALDVTDPNNISVLWDQTGTAAPAGMGYILGTPIVGQIWNGQNGSNFGGQDVVLLPNGTTRPGETYSGFDKASLFVMAASTGSLVFSRTDAVDSTDSTAVSNALMNIRGWDIEGDGLIDTVYGGDLRGSVWKFDLSGNSPSVQQFFLAKDSSGNRQPITGGISISINPSDYSTWVHFGTGRFLTASDLSDKSVQSLYGVKDIGSNSALTRSALQQRSIVSETLSGGTTYRFLTDYGVLDSTKKGWYFDLKDPTAGAEGERIVGTPREIAGQLRVTSGIPGSSACDPVDGGFLYILDAFRGTSSAFQPVDTNGDGTVDNDDKINGKTVGGVSLSHGLPGDDTQTGDLLTIGGSDTGTDTKKVKDDSSSGRVSWREIIQN